VRVRQRTGILRASFAGDCVTVCYGMDVARSVVTLSYDEAMAVCLLLAEAADASVDDELLRDTWATEARLMIELILGRTDER
jgi:hypothetical protein